MKLFSGKQHRRGAWTLAAMFGLGAAALLATGVAVANSGPPPVSGADPFVACTAGAPGFNFPSTEVEPYVGVNPTNSDNIVGVYQQDRWEDGGARGLAASVTNDGGQTWSTVPLPFSSCASGGLAYQRASDPWISFGPDGTAYAVGIVFDETTTRNAIAAAVSHDGGSTWGDVHTIITDKNKVFDDKDSVTADPKHPGVAYAVWDRVNSGRLDNQPSYFSRTTNYGKSWSKPKRITSNARNQGSIGEVVVVDPRNDTLYDVYDALRFHGSQTFATENVMVSHNQGKTWSRPVIISPDLDLGVVNAPVTGAELRTGSGLPDAAIDPKTGELYVVWEDSRFSHGQYDEVALSRSKNGGRTWSAPIRIDKKTGLPAVSPMVAVNSNGVVGVSYFDFRASPASDPSTLATSYWLATSARGGKSFKSEQPIIDTPFDLLSAPFSEGYFLGDYQGLTTNGTSFVSFYAAATGTETTAGDPSNRTNVYFKNLQP